MKNKFDDLIREKVVALKDVKQFFNQMLTRFQGTVIEQNERIDALQNEITLLKNKNKSQDKFYKDALMELYKKSGDDSFKDKYGF